MGIALKGNTSYYDSMFGDWGTADRDSLHEYQHISEEAYETAAGITDIENKYSSVNGEPKIPLEEMEYKLDPSEFEDLIGVANYLEEVAEEVWMAQSWEDSPEEKYAYLTWAILTGQSIEEANEANETKSYDSEEEIQNPREILNSDGPGGTPEDLLPDRATAEVVGESALD